MHCFKININRLKELRISRGGICVDPILTGIATSVIVKGAKFLYGQAKKVLRAWRKRGLDPEAPLAEVLEPPREVTMGDARPLSEPVNEAMADVLADLKDMVEHVKDEDLDPDSQEARKAVAELRELLENVRRTPITFEGEPPRTLEVSDISVTVEEVEGYVAGVRARADKLAATSTFRNITVKAGNVKKEGKVIGWDQSQ